MVASKLFSNLAVRLCQEVEFPRHQRVPVGLVMDGDADVIIGRRIGRV